LKGTKASPPLPSHDTPLPSRKSQLREGKEATAGGEKSKRKGGTFGLLLF